MKNFNTVRDTIISDIDEGVKQPFTYPLKKIGGLLGGYPRKEFIAIGGRRTSGKSYFLLNNYVIAPILQEIKALQIKETLGLNLIYVSNKRTLRTTLERMIVNISSNFKKGNKVGIPSIYNTPNNKNKKISRDKAKSAIISGTSALTTLENKKKLHLLSNKFTVDSLKDTISDIMGEFGLFNGDHSDFTFNDKYSDLTNIIVIDDASGIFGSDGTPALKNTSAIELGIMLKHISRVFNALVVLGVPSSIEYYRDSFYKGYINVMRPYDTYTDRLLLLHNPLETYDMTPLNYDLKEFMNPSTGINYFRFVNVLANHSGPSNVQVALFMYPENGYFRELPGPDHTGIESFHKKVLDD
jgi:hypothetical protein